VVIPTNRGGAYVRESVGSVLAQTFTDLELIIVSDGCPDDLTDLEVLDDRIRIIRQENRGVSVARNVGIHAARSDLIAFIDDDDRMRPERIEAQYELMERRADLGLCHTQFRLIDEDGAPGSLGYAGDVQYVDLLHGDVHILLPTTMMRKSLLEEIGMFDPSLTMGEDLDQIYRVARQSPLGFLPEELTEYRRHGSNASGNELRNAYALLTLLRDYRWQAEAHHRPDVAAAAEVGIASVSRYGATGAVLDARAAWRRHDVPLTMHSIATAVRLSPTEAARDLVTQRPVVRRLLRVRDRGATARVSRS
jgi:glycosyltransferase involved in cell wall biosynthesis